MKLWFSWSVSALLLVIAINAEKLVKKEANEEIKTAERPWIKSKKAVDSVDENNVEAVRPWLSGKGKRNIPWYKKKEYDLPMSMGKRDQLPMGMGMGKRDKLPMSMGKRDIPWYKKNALPWYNFKKDLPWYSNFDKRGVIPSYKKSAIPWYKKMAEKDTIPWYKKMAEREALPWYGSFKRGLSLPWYKFKNVGEKNKDADDVISKLLS